MDLSVIGKQTESYDCSTQVFVMRTDQVYFRESIFIAGQDDFYGTQSLPIFRRFLFMFRYRLLKTAGVIALGVSIVVCSGCAVLSTNSFFDSTEEAVSASSTDVPTEEIQMSNEQTAFTSGYSHVDFSKLDTSLIFASEKNGSLLGQPGYCYGTLSEEEQAVYEEIYAAVTGFEGSCVLATTDSEMVHRVYSYVIADHPEIFWLEGYTLNTTKRGEKVISLEFSMKQTMDQETIAGWQHVIGKYLQQFSQETEKAGINQDSSDFDVIKFTFDYIVKNTEYQETVDNNQNICSVFGSGYSVCQGYSVAMQYLLLYQGIPAVTVSGVTKDTGTGHAWNLVQSDHSWYYLDVTWGDPSFSEDAEVPQEMVNYSYFCVTEEEISKTHVVNEELVLPECTANRDNYFIHENRYFEDWDQEHFEDLVAECMEAGEDYVSIRFSNEELYQTVRKNLIDEQNIFEHMETSAGRAGEETVSRLSYFENKNFNIITFIWN